MSRFPVIGISPDFLKLYFGYLDRQICGFSTFSNTPMCMQIFKTPGLPEVPQHFYK